MSANTYGRQVVVPLTNKSGGSVAAGDVVVVDTGNNDAFTTTTTAGFTGGVGIAQETIANNATGRVLISGYAPLVNVSASVTRGHFGATHTVAKQAASSGASRGAGTFCQFLTGGTTPDAIMYPVDLLGSSLTNPMTTAEDIIKGGASGTPARLAVGAAGAALSVVNGGVAWNSGTSFPASKLTGDRFWRTDLGMEFYYDGTRWLSTQLFELFFSTSEAFDGVTANNYKFVGIPNDLPAYLVKGYVPWLNAGTNNGTNFWTFQFGYKTVGGSGTTNAGASFSTAAGASGQYTMGSVTMGVALTTSDIAMILTTTKTLNPGGLYFFPVVQYRKIAT